MATDPEDRELSFIGTGWNFPFIIDSSTGGIAKSGVAINQVSILDRIKQSIQHIITTNLKERCMRPDFGSGLRALLFEPNNEVLLRRANSVVIEAIEKWEPRIILIRATVTQDPFRGTLDIFTEFRVSETNTLENFVFPFFLFEETLVE